MDTGDDVNDDSDEVRDGGIVSHTTVDVDAGAAWSWRCVDRDAAFDMDVDKATTWTSR